MEKYFKKTFAEIVDLINKNEIYYQKKILHIVNLMRETLKTNNSIFWAGNGGSAAECQHISAELVGRFKKKRHPFKSVSLTTDTSVLTAIANDYDFSNIFSRQLEGVGKKNDLLIVLSTSGKSKNLISALNKAKSLKIKTIAFLGKSGGSCSSLADFSIIIPSNDTARIQEMHLFLLHIICDLLEKKI